MEELFLEAKTLADSIKKSEAYNKYMEAKDTIEKKAELMAQYDEFRKKCFEIQVDHNYGYYNCYEQLVNLKNLNDELLSNPIVKEFMENEYKMTNMLWKIFTLLIEEVDFNIDFLE